MKMEQTECSETSAHKIQMPENNPEERKHTTFRTRGKSEIQKCQSAFWAALATSEHMSAHDEARWSYSLEELTNYV